MREQLDHLVAGQAIVFGGDRVAYVSPPLAAAFQPGDRLLVVQDTGDLLHVPAAAEQAAARAVGRGADAFAALAGCADDADHRLLRGLRRAARRRCRGADRTANAADVAGRGAGPSTTRSS